MKIQNLIATCSLALFVASCGIVGSSSGIEVAYDGKSATIEPASTALITGTASDSVSHTFVIANYDVGDNVSHNSLSGTAKEEGRMRALFMIIGEKGTDKNSPVKTGEYPARVGNVGSSAQTVNSGNIFYSKDGKEKAVFVGGADMKEGKITINSVGGGQISGEVDITDGENSIKGPFTVNTQ